MPPPMPSLAVSRVTHRMRVQWHLCLSVRVTRHAIGVTPVSRFARARARGRSNSVHIQGGLEKSLRTLNRRACKHGTRVLYNVRCVYR